MCLLKRLATSAALTPLMLVSIMPIVPALVVFLETIGAIMVRDRCRKHPRRKTTIGNDTKMSYEFLACIADAKFMIHVYVPGQAAWYVKVKVTFPPSAASYSDNTCFGDTLEYYDWNKLWGKARCGYSHGHQQDSDRFVWRRLQDLHTTNPNCGGRADCTGIQLGTYSYDAGTTPYPNENWRLSQTFSTIVQPNVAYILGMESFADGSVLHSLYDGDWTLLETKTNVHNNRCEANYEQGSVLGLYFGGTCTAPDDIKVAYEAMVDGPPDDGTSGPSVSPTKSPSQGPSRMPSSSPVGPSVSPTKSPSQGPSRMPSSSPVGPTMSPTVSNSCMNTSYVYVVRLFCFLITIELVSTILEGFSDSAAFPSSVKGELWLYLFMGRH